MRFFPFFPTTAMVALLALGGSQTAQAASDYRKIQVDRDCTIETLALEGILDVMVLDSATPLKTLYKVGDQYQLQGGKEYVLKFSESSAGFFAFDLRFTPKDSPSSWSCRVKTIADPPFIKVDHGVWTGPEGKVVINTNRYKDFITLQAP